MRNINPENFTKATRGTSREINRQILLTLIRAHQPISRADLSRLMDMNRSNITLLVNELLAEKLVREGDQGSTRVPGRKPTFLYINSEKGYAIGLDVRATRTFIMITDSIGQQIGEIASFPTKFDSREFVASLGRQIRERVLELGLSSSPSSCDGIGIVFPGMVDRESGVVINAPKLGWKDVPLIEMLKAEFGETPIHLENSGRACALSQIWARGGDPSAHYDSVFVSVADGVGVGVVVNGVLIRGVHNIAGEFAHVPLSIDVAVAEMRKGAFKDTYVDLQLLGEEIGRRVADDPFVITCKRRDS